MPGNYPECRYLPAYEDGTDSVPKRRHLKFRCRGITQKVGTYLPMKMEQCSETSAYKIQVPGNYPGGRHLTAYEDGTDKVFRNVGI